MKTPVRMTPEVMEEICVRIASGMSVRQIGMQPDMPNEQAIYRHIATNPDFSAQVLRARSMQQLAIMDDIVEAAERIGGTDIYLEKYEDIKQELTSDKARLVIAAKQWQAAKMAPRIFGDNKQVEINSQVNVTTTNVLDVSNLDMEQLDVLERVLNDTIMKTKTIEHKPTEGDDDDDDTP